MPTSKLSPEPMEWIDPEIAADALSYVDNKGKKVYDGILPFLRGFEPMHERDPGYRDSLATYFSKQLRRDERRETPPRDLALSVICGYIALSDVLGGELPKKSRNFVYLPNDPTNPPTLKIYQAIANACFMTDRFGPELFHSNLGQNEGYYRAKIDDKFALTVKAGTGAGTFSVDLAIEYNTDNPEKDAIRPSHEIWRTGIDTSPVETRLLHGRVVRTGSGIKPGDYKKLGSLVDFKNEYGMVPARSLALLVSYVLYALDLSDGRALSDKGATELSTFGRSRRSDPMYSKLFKAVGFCEGNNPYWLNRSFTNFYSEITAKTSSDPGQQPHESEPMHLLVSAFNRMTTNNGRPFPLRLFENDNDQAVAEHIDAHIRRNR